MYCLARNSISRDYSLDLGTLWLLYFYFWFVVQNWLLAFFSLGYVSPLLLLLLCDLLLHLVIFLTILSTWLFAAKFMLTCTKKVTLWKCIKVLLKSRWVCNARDNGQVQSCGPNCENAKSSGFGTLPQGSPSQSRAEALTNSVVRSPSCIWYSRDSCAFILEASATVENNMGQWSKARTISLQCNAMSQEIVTADLFLSLLLSLCLYLFWISFLFLFISFSLHVL